MTEAPIHIKRGSLDIEGKTVTLVSHKGFGISIRDSKTTCGFGDQLFGIQDKTLFSAHRVQPYVYKLESVAIPRSYIGVGSKREFGDTKYFKAVLVRDEDESALLRIVSQDDDSVRLEPINYPGFHLGYWDDMIWFFDDSGSKYDPDLKWNLQPIFGEETFRMAILEGKRIKFRSEGKLGLSTRNRFGLMKTGKLKLYSTADGDMFRLHKEYPYIYKFESITEPGAFIGIRRQKSRGKTKGFQAMLVGWDDESAYLRAIPSINGDPDFISLESVNHPRFLLSEYKGEIFFFKEPADNWENYTRQSSWHLSLAEEDQSKEQPETG